MPIHFTSIVGGAKSHVVCGLSLLLFLLAGCAEPADQGGAEVLRFGGNTMGTSYQVIYGASSRDSVDSDKAAVENLLLEVNESLSTYIDTSLISRINSSSNPALWHPVDSHFLTVFERAQDIYKKTGGAFNPAVGPLVKAFGFGPDLMDNVPDSSVVDSLRGLVDFESFLLIESNKALQKRNVDASLDFSAIAKGYGVDVISTFFEARGTKDYFVEIGGEVRTGGAHPEGRPWRVGIERPTENQFSEQATQAVVVLGDNAMATSGNYRNFYVRDGRKYVHTIDPATGYPKISSLLSASVVARDCMTADAYATSFMVMGLDQAIALVESDSDLEAFFIVAGEDGEFVEHQSSGFAAYQNEQSGS